MIDTLHTGSPIARRLDYIDSARACGNVDKLEYEEGLQKFESDIDSAWGVSFGAGLAPMPAEPEKVVMTLHIDEKNEKYVLDRLKREGRNGKVEHIEKNVFSYSNEVWDSNEILPFIMSFIGRIISLECGNAAKDRFWNELNSMISMYGTGE